MDQRYPEGEFLRRLRRPFQRIYSLPAVGELQTAPASWRRGVHGRWILRGTPHRWARHRVRVQPGRARVRDDHPRHRNHPFRAGRTADAGLDDRALRDVGDAPAASDRRARVRDARRRRARRGDGVPGLSPAAAAPRAADERDHRDGGHVDPVHQRGAHHLGLGAAALSGDLPDRRVRVHGRAPVAAARVDHGVRRGADGAAAALPAAHAHRPCDAGGRAGRRRRAAHGRESHAHHGLHLRHLRE